MKKLFSTLICLLAVLCSASASYSFTYVTNSSTGTAKVIKCTGDVSGVIEIPEKTTISGKEYIVTAVEGNVFQKCKEITEIQLPNTITAIGGSAFAFCTNLTKINIPTSLEALAGNIFECCTSLTMVELPSNILRINQYAFKGCINLKTLVIYNSTSVVQYNNGILIGCNKALQIYVMPSLLETYKSDSNWKSHNIVTLYTVNGLNSVSNGTVTADKPAYLPGSTAEFTITPKANYKISKVTINGKDVTSQVVNGLLSYSNVSQDITIAVTFEQYSYATPVKNITTTEQDLGKIYNLMGQEVDGDYKGIVISNGRKYLKR